MKEKLISFGLTSNEAEVYLTMLNLGIEKAGKITAKSGIHRRSVYDAIDRLIEKGLVSYIKKNNVKYYEVLNPEIFLELEKKKKDDLEAIIPSLKQIFEEKKEKKETTFFRGKNGIKSIFLDQLSEGKEILILGASKDAKNILQFYLPHYEKERIKKKINAKIIFPLSAKKEKLKIPKSIVKYMPDDILGPAATNIYADKVAIIIWTQNPYAILIKDKDVSESYRKNFEFIWNSIN